MPDRAFSGPVCALVLAGGRSRRMGTDKALLTLEGSTLLERAVRFWREQPGVDRVLAAVGERDRLPDLPAGAEPVYDLYPGCGPLAGLHAAFTQTDAALLYVSAVDMPFLAGQALPPVPAGDAALYMTDGRPEPLFAVYQRSCLPALTAALAAGRCRVTDFLRDIRAEYLPLPRELRPTLSNLNTRADYLRALAGDPPAVCCMGWSGAGKTTLLEKLLPVLADRGVRTAVIKHDAHGFQLDKPGKDTWRLSAAGAAAVGISGPGGWAVLSREQTTLDALRRRLPPSDLVLVEGHKGSPLPKFQIYRAALEKPFLPPGPEMFAVVTDDTPHTSLPLFGLENAAGLASLLIDLFLNTSE